MKTKGQTLSGDLEGGVLMCCGGSLGPVGSPGWRRRELHLLEEVNWRVERRRTEELRGEKDLRVDVNMARFRGMTMGGMVILQAAF
jgi:hypothetical protein